ncbi:MAG: hypothetical protein ACQERS_09345 [Bacteroidota bacterium]
MAYSLKSKEEDIEHHPWTYVRGLFRPLQLLSPNGSDDPGKIDIPKMAHAASKIIRDAFCW